MAGKDPANQPPAPPAPPAPTNQPPAPPAPTNQPPAPSDGQPPAWFTEFQSNINQQIKTLGDQVAKAGQPAPRDPLAEVDKLNEQVRGATEWVAQQTRKPANWFERTFLGVRSTPPPQQPSK